MRWLPLLLLCPALAAAQDRSATFLGERLDQPRDGWTKLWVESIGAPQHVSVSIAPSYTSIDPRRFLPGCTTPCALYLPQGVVEVRGVGFGLDENLATVTITEHPALLRLH